MDKYILPRKEAITVFFCFCFWIFFILLVKGNYSCIFPVFTLEFDLIAADL
jgi:hypothetical protein